MFKLLFIKIFKIFLLVSFFSYGFLLKDKLLIKLFDNPFLIALAIAFLFGKHLIIPLPLILPPCLSPMSIHGIFKDGTSIIPLDEFPNTKLVFFIIEKAGK